MAQETFCFVFDFLVLLLLLFMLLSKKVHALVVINLISNNMIIILQVISKLNKYVKLNLIEMFKQFWGNSNEKAVSLMWQNINFKCI